MADLGTRDVVVIGGGINGTGLARDAAGRGLSVLLCEKGDLAEGTSSRSTRLIHGGLRYLQHGQLRLVREALQERERLLRAAPHLVRPLRFVMPHVRGRCPAWRVRAGLFLYDHLSRRDLPGARSVALRQVAEGAVLAPALTRGFLFSDCWVDDARLVVLNAVDARARGADIRTRMEVVSARRSAGLWALTLRGADGAHHTVACRALVNAAGPWVLDIITRVAKRRSRYAVQLIKGSHLVTRRFWSGPQAYALPWGDRRVTFLVPAAGDTALVGTYDVPFEGRPEEVAIEGRELDTLLGVVNGFLAVPLRREDILSTMTAVRPLWSGGTGPAHRDWVSELDDIGGQAPLLSLFGGKMTTYRAQAEAALDRLRPVFSEAGPAWTAKTCLPGGDLPEGGLDGLAAALGQSHAWLPRALALHYAGQYGTRAHDLLEGAGSLADLGPHLGGLLFGREAAFLRRTEWAETAADVLERRTARGLALSPEGLGGLERILADTPA